MMGRKAARNMYSRNNNKIKIRCICWFYSQRSKIPCYRNVYFELIWWYIILNWMFGRELCTWDHCCTGFPLLKRRDSLPIDAEYDNIFFAFVNSKCLLWFSKKTPSSDPVPSCHMHLNNNISWKLRSPAWSVACKCPLTTSGKHF